MTGARRSVVSQMEEKMKRHAFTATAAATLLATGSAAAGGLDRAGNNIDILFEEGDVAELSLGYVAPDVSGTDLPLPPFAAGGASSGDVADNYFQGALAYKQQLDERLSFALILDQPYGANIGYATAADGGSAVLGGTEAIVDTSSLTGMLRYEFNENWSVHGGLRAQQLNAFVALNGFAYGIPGGLVGTPGLPAGTLNGYEASFDGDTSLGWQVGAAYEIPAIALRVAVTYFSEIDHDAEVTETLSFGPAAGVELETSDIEITTPEAVNISWQTGIAEDTLLFGSFRWADYSVVTVSPELFNGLQAANPLNPSTGNSLTEIDIVRDVSIGIGRRFDERFAGSIEFLYSDEGDDDLVSPLAPTNGSYGVTLAGSYVVSDQVTVSGGINYTRLGDAQPETGTPDVARADFDDNDAIGVGLRLAYRF
jgi:long-subunit fatty acid transport protein